MAYANSWGNQTQADPLGITIAPTAHDVLLAGGCNDATSGTVAFTTTNWVEDAYETSFNVFDGQVSSTAHLNDATGSETQCVIDPSAATGSAMIGAAVAFSGRDNTSPISASNAAGTDAGAASPSTQDVTLTPLHNNCDLCIFMFLDVGASNNATFAVSTTAGTTSAWTVRQDLNSGFRNCMVATATQTTAGAITVRVTSTHTGTSAGRRVVIYALKPAAAGGSYTLTADRGSFTLTGQAANLQFGRKLAAAQASFALSGQSANLLFGRKLTAAQGSFALSGQNVSLLFNRKLTAAQGSFALSGQAATLVYSSVGSYTLTAAAGSFALTGKDASLLYGRKMPAAVGSFTLTGFAAGLNYATAGAYTLSANPGLFTLTGKDASLQYSGGTPIETPFYGGGGGFTPIERKSFRKEVEEDVQAAIAQLTHVTQRAEVAIARPEPPPLAPFEAGISQAMRQALAAMDERLSAAQRTSVQMALSAAREAQRKLEARQREAAEQARIELAHRQAKRRRAAAIAAAVLFGDDD